MQAKLTPGTMVGRWRLIEQLSRKPRIWLCECACGVRRSVWGTNLNSIPRSRSCGCLNNEMRYLHGESRRGRTSSEYKIWQDIKTRCFNHKSAWFRRYGGRGISMYDGWINNFQAFFDHVGRRPSKAHSLDRINNDGNYEPGNVRWATQREQCLNMSTNHLVTFRGETRPVAEWADIRHIKQETIRARLRRGWTPEDALTTPVMPPTERRGSRHSTFRIYHDNGIPILIRTEATGGDQ